MASAIDWSSEAFRLQVSMSAHDTPVVAAAEAVVGSIESPSSSLGIGKEKKGCQGDDQTESCRSVTVMCYIYRIRRTLQNARTTESDMIPFLPPKSFLALQPSDGGF